MGFAAGIHAGREALHVTACLDVYDWLISWDRLGRK
jgi:hypothetical protein